MNLLRVVQSANLVWLLSEVLLVVLARSNRRGLMPRDRGSRTILWLLIGAGIATGSLIQPVSAAAPWLLGISLMLIVVGLAIRWVAIITLGRFFTTSVAIHGDHRLVRAGLFRLVRHPSYTGLLLLFVGMALSFGNWLSFVAIVLPFLAALRYRIQVASTIVRPRHLAP